ncbi:MAG: tannase/feruloyl esterase family alpha/beta hydrolase [Rhodospirillales bacterium]
MLGALIAWREFAITPTRITATKYVNDDASQGIAFQRPLCPYPQNAKYTKKRFSSALATSWNANQAPT